MSDDSRRSILAVDDAPENISVIKALLGEKYKLKVALNGTSALKIAARGIDLILLDIQMPGMDGFEVYTKLKEVSATAGIPVIFLSGEDQPVFKDRALLLGAAAFVTKPVDPTQLLQAIDNQFQ